MRNVLLLEFGCWPRRSISDWRDSRDDLVLLYQAMSTMNPQGSYVRLLAFAVTKMSIWQFAIRSTEVIGTSRIAAVGLLAGLVLFTVRQLLADGKSGDWAADVVRARSFELLDDKGRTVAKLQPMTESWPGITVSFGEEKKGQFYVLAIPGGITYCSLNSASGDAQVGIGVSPDGTAGIAFGKGGKPGQFSVGISKDGGSFVDVDVVRADLQE